MTGTLGRGRLAAFLASMLVTASAFVATAGRAVAAPPPGAPPATAAPHSLSADEASERATSTGKAVEATQAANSTDTLIANPDGTMTLSRSATPTRARVDGEWQDLDPTLVQNPDGSWSPRVSSTPLVLSNGGPGAMATMSGTGLSAGIVPPEPLRAPTVVGDTATYAQVLPGVDLKVTAKPHGGFAEVFVVADAGAAANDELTELVMPTELSGVTLTTDDAGNVTGTDRTGSTVLTAPTPKMWDSTMPATKVRGPATTKSSFRGPGAGARTALVGTRVRNGKIELTPDRKLLDGAATRYPVYIDPAFTWSVSGGKYNGWSTVPEQFPRTKYWKATPDPLGRMQVGNPSGRIKSRTFINFPLSTTNLAGATIHTATMKITQTRAWSCTPSRVNLYAPSVTLSSGNATWDFWAGQNLGPVIDNKTVAHGYSGCPAGGVAFDIRSAVEADLAAKRGTQTFALVAADENSDNGWKEFLETSPTFEVTYNHEPNTPTGMSTSPATTCTAATPTLIGLGDVSLFSPVSDRDGGTLGVTFHLWRTDTPGKLIASSDPARTTMPSGGTGVLPIGFAALEDAADEKITQFSWRVRATDFYATGGWSAICSFRFDPTRTGTPEVQRPANGTTRIGQSVGIQIARPPSGTVPTNYAYQINGGAHGTVPASATDGSASITVTPTRSLNTLTVTGLSPAGNVGQTTTVMFNSDAAEPALEGDLDGDDITDVLTPGGRNNLASGLWFAQGKDATGALGPAAVNVGARGSGASENHLPSEFDGAQTLAGRFSGTGVQDVLTYYPSGVNAGSAIVLRGTGDGSPLQSQLSENVVSLPVDTFRDRNQLTPLQIANAGYAAGNTMPDLVGITGSAETGYYLSHLDQNGTLGDYWSNPLPEQLTPTGGVDWDTWTIAGTPNKQGKATVFLWQKTTGLLYAWRALMYDDDLTALTYTQQRLATSWNAGQNLTLEAADVNNDDLDDLWTVGANAIATAYLAGDTGVAAAAGQKVLTANHAWLLKDGASGTVTGSNAAKDSVGTMPLTGAGGARWDSGDLFDRVVSFDGTNSMLTSTGPAVRTDADFTVSLWVKPDRAGGTILAQDGSLTPGFKLWINSTNQSWEFSMATTNAANPAWVYASARPRSVTTDVWTHLSASYQRSTGVIDLHVNRVDVASAVNPSPWNASGVLRVGAEGATNGAVRGYFQGQIAEVFTYNSMVIYDKGNTRIRDYNGDHRTDVIAAYQDGSLLLYRGNGAGNFRPGYAIVDSRWNEYDAMLSPGDFDNDGNNDLMGRKPDGSLWLLRGNGAGGWLTPKGGDRIGSGGWNTFNVILSSGDFDGDGNNDVIVRRPDGFLWIYRGDGRGGWRNGDGGTRIEDGGGWGSYRRLFSPGDFDGDGKADLMGAESDGILKLFRGNGAGGWLNRTSPKEYGGGWAAPTAIFSPGDFTGDGYSDVITRDADGFLWLYRGNGAGAFRGARENIGKGWNTMSKIT
ncbi:FG-GAP-like repeat-containing protein [Actinoplanes sp. NPDC051470]|uniref:FG-GAP-like repeat-containing protein n=1 Tax=Actinoplanes sp. NPDC051470 TaxID=3157224 RepID=UPI00343301A1